MDLTRFDRWRRLAGRGLTRRTAARTLGTTLAAAALAGRPRLWSVSAQDATPTAGSAGCPATTTDENKELVRRYWAEVWTAGGVAAIPALLAEDEVHHWGVGGDTTGHDAFAERLGAFLTAFPDFAIRIDQLVAEGGLVASRWTATASHGGEWGGVAASGQAVEYTGINVFRVACGKIAEGWGEADHLGLLRQIGALPMPTAPAASPVADLMPGSGIECPTEPADANRAVAGRWFAEAVNPGQLDRLDEIVAPEGVLHATAFPDAVGPAAIRGVFESLRTGFPDLRFAVEPGPAEGDLVVERWTASGTHAGVFQGVPATGTAATWTGINIYRIVCGQIAEVWTEADTLGRLRQLGGAPGSGTPVAIAIGG